MSHTKANRRITGEMLLNLLLLAVPAAIILEWLHANPVAVFASCCIGIIPLAGWMGRATEHLAEHLGEGAGGILNATFGNAAELIIALAALREGLTDVVKASITGSIIGNVLLVMGLSVLLGGIRHKRQTFNQTAAGMSSTMLALSAIGLIVPAIFHYTVGDSQVQRERELSMEISVVLFITYLLGLYFSLKTHRHLYAGISTADTEKAYGSQAPWSRTRSLLVLMASTVLVAVLSEFLVGAVEYSSQSLGLTPVFVGVILVAIVGNAAEHSTAVMMAIKNRMDLSLGVAIGSSIQIALFVAPILVFAGWITGQPMDLIFTTFEVLSVVVAVVVVGWIAMDGESNWMEGVQLLAVYVILALAFFFLP
jgi:Ca2+:H+ antiporter